jgi:ankyrin repeat protein
VNKTKQRQQADTAAFFKVVAKGDIARLKAQLDAGQRVDARDDTGKTALMRAAEHGNVEATRALLTAGANANASVSDRDSIWFGCNALIFAAQSGDAELVELLTRAGASPACAAADATTPLSIAVEHKSPRTVGVLLKAGAPLAKDILVASVWNNTADVSCLLIDAGADVNACDDLGQPVVHKAAEQGHAAILRALIRSNAKLNQKANSSTPLLVAIQNGHEDCALELIRAGADLSVTGLSRRDALMNAAALGQAAIVRALLKAGANPNAKDQDGKTALMLANEKEHSDVIRVLRGSGSDESGYKVQEYIRAAMKGDVERVRQLLKAGVDVNATYQNGAKALTSAVKNGHTDVVRLLIESGVDVGATIAGNLWGVRFEADALALAAEAGHLEIVRLLIKAGTDVNRSRMFRSDVLSLAAKGGHADVIREILGAGFSLRGRCGLEALESAVRRRKEEAARVLLEAGVRPHGKDAAHLLVSAAEEGMTSVVKALLDAGADPKARDEFDETALQAAKSAGHKAVVAVLEKANSPQASPGLELVEAAERGDLRTVHRLILEGVDLESRDAKGATALIRASANCHLPVMKALLAAGANPNASTPVAKRDKKKWFHHMDLTSATPLSCAVAAHGLPAVELLLDAGADIRKTECGHVACMILQEGTEEGAALVERLLDAGMDPDARWPVINVSALEIAAQQGFTSLFGKLIRSGARLKTPLERDRAIVDAIRKEHLDAARLLIQQGIALRVRGTITAEALVAAATAGLDEIVRLLLKRGVKIDRRVDTSFEREGSVEGITALMAAARHGHESTVSILLRAGADAKAEDAIGRTALDWAQDNKDRNAVQKVFRLIEAAAARSPR